MMGRPPTGFALLHALSGLGVWAVCFVVLYGGLSLGCASGFAQRDVGPFPVVSLALLVAWALHAALLGVMLARAWRRARRGVGAGAALANASDAPGGTAFVRWLTVVLHGMSFAALVALAAPLLVLKPCV